MAGPRTEREVGASLGEAVNRPSRESIFTTLEHADVLALALSRRGN